MHQFVVPQFISVENRIFGPITVRQFLILLTAGILIFIFFRLFEMYLFIFLTFIVGGSALIIAFVTIRGQTFHYFMLNFIVYARRPTLRVWNKQYTTSELEALRKEGMIKEKVEVEKKQRPSRSHIRQLSLQVNTGGYYEAGQEYQQSQVEDIDIG